ncbi:hypothetical protein HGRIS_010246 [Hohenbuehelia grisea]|uniref:F-box domain-containing protein n=1 Tax=Hohenbuehelia grisea TaxID=104357 RepID=A0ABR3J3P8_9AGAR
MSLVLDRFRAWNYFLPGFEDAPMITDLFSSHDAQLPSKPKPFALLPLSTRETRFQPCSSINLSFSKLRLVDAVRLAPTSPQPQAVGTSIPPIHQLPTELVAEIFALCHAAEEDHRGNSASACARVILSHVCRRWRAVILCMPLLWSTISVHGPGDSSLSRLKAHLERSGTCPLSLRFIAHISTTEGRVENIADILTLAVAHAQRWRALRLYISEDHARPILNLIRATSFPSIETLEISVDEWEQQDSHAIFEALSSSSIRKLSWRGPRGIPPSPHWTVLTHIHVRSPLSICEAHTLLSQCHVVVELRLDSVSTEGSPSDRAMVTLPELEVLSVSTYEALDGFFDKLCTPRLRRLVLRHFDRISTSNDSCGAIDPFLARSNCALEELVFRDDHMPSDALDRLLRVPCLDTVRDLSIELPPLNDRALETLTRRMHGEFILPRLESLFFWRSQSTDGTLGDMLASRSQGGEHSLKRLRTGIDGSRLRDRHALDGLKLGGMDIDYEC